MMIANTHDIRRFAEAVLCLEPCMMTGKVDPDQVKVLMGEMLDLWPMSIFAGCDEEDDPKHPVALEESDEDGDFIESGTPVSSEANFISEEEDENPPGAIPGMTPALPST